MTGEIKGCTPFLVFIGLAIIVIVTLAAAIGAIR